MDIQGPVGALQAQFDSATDPQGMVAVLCHPHPQYGGSMHDAVLQTAADVFLANGIDCMRFNFRGVGASDGHYDNGVGEVQDLLAVADWVGDTHGECQQCWLGYSFGAAVVWRALQSTQPARVILVAPPVGMMDFSGAAPRLRVDAIAGDRDDFVDLDKLAALTGVTSHVIQGADHFFAGCHGALSNSIGDLLK